jgi:tetratricopeptide (TPR) repeat protein
LSEAEKIPDSTDRHRCLGVLHAGYASTRNRQGRFQEAIEHAEKAAAEAEAAGDRETLAYAYHLLDRIHTATGSREEGLRYRDAALPIFAELGDLAAQGTVLHDLAADAHRGGRLEEATWLYERAIDARTRVGDVVRAAASVNALGEVELELGMPDQAERRFTDALRTWRGARSPEGIAVATANLGSLHLSRGDVTGGVEKLEEAHALADAIGAESLLNTTGLLLAETYLRLGRSVEAWKMATEILDSGGDTSTVVRARRLRAQALSATGGASRARAELTEALDLADRSGLDDEATAIRALFNDAS